MIAARVKKLYFKKLLEQDIGWFEEQNPEKLTTLYTEEISSFTSGVGGKNQGFIFGSVMVIAGFTIGFVQGWMFTLIICAILPFMMIGMGLFVYSMERM
jgi:ATP-binding cassette, subfamily B (MDR/TAP), member 1